MKGSISASKVDDNCPFVHLMVRHEELPKTDEKHVACNDHFPVWNRHFASTYPLHIVWQVYRTNDVVQYVQKTQDMIPIILKIKYIRLIDKAVLSNLRDNDAQKIAVENCTDISKEGSATIQNGSSCL